MLFDILVTVKVIYVMRLFEIAVKKRINFINVKQFIGYECSNTRNIGK